MTISYDLYVVTDEGLSKGLTHAEIARQAIAGGADVIQLRDKKNPEAAVPDFQQYLVESPDSPLADQVRSLLAEAVESGKKSPSPSP